MSQPPGSGARSLILGRIRDILGRRPAAAAAEYQLIARGYQQAAAVGEAERIELLADRLQHYQVGVYRSEPATLRRTIAETLAVRNRTRLVVPRDLPREWLPPALQAIDDEGLSYPELDRTEGVLTGCSLAIASTGTIVLRHRHAEGRRALTLVPDYHLCVVSHDQVVETVPEAMRLLAARKPALVTTISGPSATADIEMTRVRGVHGPRTLDVILVGRST
jgi:L-lactate dehydrogenase complex protein LldG